MNARDLWHRKSGLERVPDVMSNLPRVLNSSLAAANAVREALNSTMAAVDAAKAGSNADRRQWRRSPWTWKRRGIRATRA